MKSSKRQVTFLSLIFLLKCCKTKKTKNPQKNPTGSRPKEHKGTVNQMKFEDHPDSDSDYAFTIVDENQPTL